MVIGTGFVKPTATDEDAGEDRLANISGEWSEHRGAGLYGQHRYNASGAKLTIGPITDRVRVRFLTYSGGGTATTKLDGVSAASINANLGSGVITTHRTSPRPREATPSRSLSRSAATPSSWSSTPTITDSLMGSVPTTWATTARPRVLSTTPLATTWPTPAPPGLRRAGARPERLMLRA